MPHLRAAVPLAVLFLILVSAAALAQTSADPPQPTRPRLRDLGVSPGVLPPGPLNAITDVAGVRVGHRTIVRDGSGGAVRTGVTAILPHGGDLFFQKTPAAVWVGNGFGKAAGFLQVQELGNLETPVVLTNTLAVGTAIEAVVAWTLAQPGHEKVRSVNAVVGETNDGYSNDIRGRHVTAEDVRAAIAAAQPGPVEEGSVGAGTGNHGVRLERRDRHGLAPVPPEPRRLDRGRARADELRRRADDRRRAGRRAARPLPVQSGDRGGARRLLHDRAGDRRAAVTAQPGAPGCPRGPRPRPHRLLHVATARGTSSSPSRRGTSCRTSRPPRSSPSRSSPTTP